MQKGLTNDHDKVVIITETNTIRFKFLRELNPLVNLWLQLVLKFVSYKLTVIRYSRHVFIQSLLIVQEVR